MTEVFVFPGQGSQKIGMGEELFAEFPDLASQASDQLGYCIKTLCLQDPNKQLKQTQYTQPAIYVVSALAYLHKISAGEKKPDFVAGHSLGEYTALFVSEAFDFITGLKLVQKRGELMGMVSDSSMAAVVGLPEEKIVTILREFSLSSIDIANLNTPDQIVIAGPVTDLERARKVFRENGGRYLMLNVSAAFHSRYMENVQKQFALFLNGVQFSPLTIPVIANTTALPYRQEDIEQNLTAQITSPVRWSDSILYLLRNSDPEFEEVGPGTVLTGMITKIKVDYQK